MRKGRLFGVALLILCLFAGCASASPDAGGHVEAIQLPQPQQASSSSSPSSAAQSESLSREIAEPSEPAAAAASSLPGPEPESLTRGTAEPSEPEAALACLAGVQEASSNQGGAAQVLTPTAPGDKTFSDPGVSIDYSNAEQGYVMVQYSGSNPKVKLQMSGSNQTLYTYTLRKGQFDAFPLTSGNGTYTLKIYENVSGSQYALLASHSFEVQLRSALSPYLYPNQYVSFTSSSAAVAKGAQLAEGAKDNLEVVQRVYNFVTENVVYDDGKAQSAAAGSLTGYLPNVDETLRSGKGICFDYAALMTAMLRSQGIPTRLEVGYVTGGIYHAWISIYLQNEGWVNGIIHFNGKKWTLMDPTFAANSGGSEEVKQFIGNGSNYSTKFVY